jgi:hypothetical protein
MVRLRVPADAEAVGTGRGDYRLGWRCLAASFGAGSGRSHSSTRQIFPVRRITVRPHRGWLRLIVPASISELLAMTSTVAMLTASPTLMLFFLRPRADPRSRRIVDDAVPAVEPLQLQLGLGRL